MQELEQSVAAAPGEGVEPALSATLPSTDATPHLPRGEERFIRAFALLTLAYTIYYLTWRWTETLNPDALWFSIPLALAESYALVTTAYTVFTVWHLKKRTPVPAPRNVAVDVFITNYDEPLDILRRTAVGARNIRYPHKTYLLDDGKRDEVRALAEELGIGYIRREGNEHAKAGNLNNALKETDGEFILQLDADHVPLPHILDRLLGFLDDPKVAFVQSPQDFYNTDSFTHDVNEEGRRMFEEQRIFFSLLQPGKDNWNAAFFCGSCGVIRRSALEDIGGFSTETITEDMETSIVLHSRGWKSVYYGESLAFGLAPGSAGAFHIQRLRWGQGSMQIFRKFNPITYPGLSLPQRICYFSSVTSYLDGVYNMFLYLAPILFFFTGVFPIAAENSEFLIRFVPYLLLNLLMFELLSRGTGFLWISARYNMAKFFTYVLAVSGYFARGRLKFNVTPKGVGHVPFKTYAPHVVLMALSVLSLGWALLARRLGWISYDIPGWGSLAFVLNFAWLTLNFGLAGYVVQLSLQLLQQRTDHRFADHLPMRYQVREAGGRLTRSRVALTENLNSGGLAFRSTEPLEAGKTIKLNLPLSTGRVEVEGEVLETTSTTISGVPTFRHRVEFNEIDLQARDAIEMHCIQHAVPIWQLQYRNTMKLFEQATDWMRNARREQRRIIRMPCNVRMTDEKGRSVPNRLGLLEEMSQSGARLILDRPVHPGTALEYRIPGTDVRGEGTAVFSTALETPLGVRYAIGIRRGGNGAAPEPPKRNLGVRALSRLEGWLVPGRAGSAG